MHIALQTSVEKRAGVTGDAVEVSPESLRCVRELYEKGQYLSAYRLAEQQGPLRYWIGTDARLMAGRLAGNIGSPRLAAVHHFLAWRAAPGHAEALSYYVRSIHHRFGAWAAWTLSRKIGDLPDAPQAIRGDWLAHRAVLAANLRDFEAADALLHRVDELDDGHAWLWVERCAVYELQDRYDDALKAARRALEVHPWYRPGVQAAAHLLGLMDRGQEALELLRQAVSQVESGLLWVQMATIERELGLFREARASLDRCLELLPLREKDTEKWLAAMRADAAYYCGDDAAAAALAREAGTPFHREIAEKLEQPPAEDARRVMLSLGFVRQHHMTCAPATLAALSRFWNRPVDHLSLVDAICYDGTPPEKERAWAEQNGWVAREFTATWDTAVRLLDRGLPFTLTTIEPGNGHVQAAIGYDARRGTLLIRDPFERSWGEVTAAAFFDRYRSTGPRGMVLLPADQAHRLKSIELPDEQSYDLYHQINLALERHERSKAIAAFTTLRQTAPNHRLAHWARRSIAIYDGDQVGQLESIETLLELYPDDPVLVLAKLTCLRNLSRREQRLELMRKACDKPGSSPVFWAQLAQELAADSREHQTARRLLRRCIRFRPTEPGSYYVLANLLWSQRQHDEALDLYRCAACLNDKDEQLADGYFNAARQVKQTEVVLQMLRDRFQRFTSRSSQPARTLFASLTMLHRTAEAFDALEQAMRQRPDDGELLLFAAEAHARYGRFGRASELLEKAGDRVREPARLRVLASVASYRGDLKTALSLWQAVLDAEPLASDAQHEVTQLLAETQGRAAAVEHLNRAAERFPHSVPLHLLRARWLRDHDPALAEQAVRRLLECNPADAFAHRELALLLIAQNRDEEALAAARESLRLDPEESYSHSVLARALAAVGRTEQAQAERRQAIARLVDNDDAIGELLASCSTPQERREALDYVRGQLVRQVINGDGLLAYRSHARQIIPQAELLEHLREALAARPDLWHAWVAVVRQLIDGNDLPAARELITQATQRFPLLPAMWMELATVCRLAGDDTGETEALRRVLEISPTWGVAVRRLAAMHDRRGELDHARELLEHAIGWMPLDAQNHVDLALVLWRLGRQQEAIDRVCHALRLDPQLDAAWQDLTDWARQMENRDVAVELARDLTERRGGEAQSWLTLARVLSGRPSPDEALAALARAGELEPRKVAVHDMRAWLLARHGRFGEALAACEPPIWGGKPPIELRGRAAWILSEQGQLDAALQRLRDIVKEDPSYFWAWEQLAHLARATEHHEEYLAAAQAILDRSTHDPDSHATLADAQRQLKNHAAAKSAFDRALQLKPDHAFAALSLMDLHLDDGELDAAAGAIERYRRVASGEYVQDYILVREIRLASKAHRKGDALRGFRELCTSANSDPWPIDAAVEALSDYLPQAEAEELLLDAAMSEPAHPHLGEIWVKQVVKYRAIEKGLERLCHHPQTPPRGFRQWWRRNRRPPGIDRPVFRAAVRAYVDLLGERRLLPVLNAHVRRYERWLREDAIWWGSVAHAWTTLQLYDRVISWMADWQQRNCEGWMLANLVVCLRDKGKSVEAAEVSRHAASLCRDGAWLIHAVWLAFDAAVAGDAPGANGLLADLDRSGLPEFYHFVVELVEAIQETQRLAASDPAGALQTGREKLTKAAANMPDWRQSHGLRLAYLCAARRIAVVCNLPSGRLWYWIRVLLPYHLGI